MYMGFPFRKYPYQDYNAYNLDYLLDEMKELGFDFKAFVEANVIKYHDPIAWNITTQYEANTIVSDGTDVYLSKQPVPAGVAVTNTDYWFKVVICLLTSCSLIRSDTRSQRKMKVIML